MREDDEDWLIAANGIYHGRPGGTWTLLGFYRYTVNQILRADGRLIAATGNGLWDVPEDRSERWVQLHDETLTEVMTIAQTDVGIAAGSPYGVAIGAEDEEDYPRWRSLTEDLRVNARFTNTILVDPKDRTRWIVGTEGGVIVGEDNGATWVESDLCDSPVRSIVRAGDDYWAASDVHGLMRSSDGHAWESVAGVDGPAFCVTGSAERLVVGTRTGVAVRSADGSVEQRGPNVLVRCITIDPEDADVWVAGADPGGVWTTRDAGRTWTNTGGFTRVRNILTAGGAS